MEGGKCAQFNCLMADSVVNFSYFMGCWLDVGSDSIFSTTRADCKLSAENWQLTEEGELTAKTNFAACL